MKGTQVVLTVAEGKRLIAKGIAAWQPVRAALASGIVAVAKGTTNAYIVEELTRQSIEKRDYVTGNTRPAGGGTPGMVSADLPDLVLRNGKRVEGAVTTEIVSEMRKGDVFLKGANAINCERGQAGILIGHPTGGTVGAALGSLVARRARLVVPTGLEKSVPSDLDEVAAHIRNVGVGPSLWVVPGDIFTEIEALRAVAKVEVRAVASGGIAGAEGAVRLLITGRDEEVDKATEVVESVKGEPPFIH